MGEVPSLFYWDANIFLSYINQVPERTPDLDALFEEARDGAIEIMSSTLSIVEVAFAAEEQLGGPLSEEIEDGIESLWHVPSPVKLVEFSTLIARRARRLIRRAREQGWSLKPADAIHLATAEQMAVDEFHTYEKIKLDKFGPICGFSVREPLAQQPQLPTQGESDPESR